MRIKFPVTAAAAIIIVLLGVLPAVSAKAGCSPNGVEVACPKDPVGPDGEPVSDQLFFAHRSLGDKGSLTVRLVSMTGIITYPPPGHNALVPGVVPWAKTGILIKDGLTPGSRYAAIMMTGSNGVRMQDNYVNDKAGRPGGVSPESPRWLRLTRDGDTITGSESADGQQWTTVGAVVLKDLPANVQIGLFTTSPSNLSLRSIGLGGHVGEARFTQATGVFDNVTTDGTVATGAWSRDNVGVFGHTDWEKNHRASGLVETDGRLEVSGSGDIAPMGREGGQSIGDLLLGVGLALILLIVVGARAARRGPIGRLPVKVFAAGLIGAAVAVGVGSMIFESNGVHLISASLFTGARVVVGAAVLLTLGTTLAYWLCVLLRRTWLAITVMLVTMVLPYLVSAVPLFPETVVEWLLRLTPAAGFNALATLEAYPQVTGHYAPYAGYFPLPWWAGLIVLGGYTALAAVAAKFPRGLTTIR